MFPKKKINTRLFIQTLISFYIIFMTSNAHSTSLKQAADFSSKRCVFVVAFGLDNKISSLERTLYKSIGDKPGDPFNRDFLCVFPGSTGEGVDKVEGCIVGTLDVKADRYYSILNPSNFSPKLSMAPGKKCAPDVAQDLLFSKRAKEAQKFLPNTDGSLFSIYYAPKINLPIYQNLPLIVIYDEIGYKEKFLLDFKKFKK